MTTTSELHDEVRGRIAETVGEVTRRAVEPVMAPFQDAYRRASGELQQNVQELHDMLETEQASLANATSRVSAMTTAVERMRTQVEESSGTLMAMRNQLRRLAIATLVLAAVTTLLAAGLVALALSA
jgi:argininosuccinate lyase